MELVKILLVSPFILDHLDGLLGGGGLLVITHALLLGSWKWVSELEGVCFASNG